MHLLVTRIVDAEQRVEHACDVGDVAVVEMDRELRLDRTAVADVHLPPQPAAGAGEFDLDRSKIRAGHLPVPGDPALLLEPIEPAAQARRRQPEVSGDVERPSAAAEALERGEHVEPSEWDVPVGAQLLVALRLPLEAAGAWRRIVVHRSVSDDTAARVNRAIRRSLEYARANPSASFDFIRKNARELEAEVTREHINLYVNDFSLSLGKEGREAVERLFAVAYERKVTGALPERIFL